MGADSNAGGRQVRLGNVPLRAAVVGPELPATLGVGIAVPDDALYAACLS